MEKNNEALDSSESFARHLASLVDGEKWEEILHTPMSRRSGGGFAYRPGEEVGETTLPDGHRIAVGWKLFNGKRRGHV
jgi:hypothetical protein